MTSPALRSDLDDDRAIAARCVIGDRAAQREMFARTRAAMHGVLYRILGSNHEMEDVAQDAFVAVFRSVHGYRGESTLATWCCAIATRTAWAYLDRRRLATTHLEALPELHENRPGAEQILGTRIAAQHLYAALDKLDARLRITFALAVLDERPLAEIAEMTGASVVAAKTRLWRARRELRRRAERDPVLAEYLGTIKPGGAP